jgi:hypothetical protein
MQKRQDFAANQDSDLTLTARHDDCKQTVIWDFISTTEHFSTSHPFAG